MKHTIISMKCAQQSARRKGAPMIKIMAWIGYIGGILVCGVVLAGGCGRQYRQPYEIMVERETVKDVGRCRRDENCMDFKVFNGTTKGE